MKSLDITIISTQLTDQYEKLKIYLGANYKFLNFPMITIEYQELNPELRKTLAEIEGNDWIVFTSMRGIIGYFNLSEKAGIEVNKLQMPKIACIGKATANELNNYKLKADYINPGNTSDEFGDYLIKDIVNQNQKVLLILGERADDRLKEKLKKYCYVSRINVYKTIDIEYFNENLKQLIDNDKYDLLIFTSPSAFQNFVRLGAYKPQDKQLKIASIGGRTTKSIEELGFEVMITAKNSDLKGLAESIRQNFKL